MHALGGSAQHLAQSAWRCRRGIVLVDVAAKVSLALFGHLMSHPFPSSSQYSSSPRSLSCQLSSVFLLLSTWLFHTHLTLKATCVQNKKCKAEFAETGFCKI